MSTLRLGLVYNPIPNLGGVWENSYLKLIYKTERHYKIIIMKTLPTTEQVEEVLEIIKALPLESEASKFVYALADEIVEKTQAQGEKNFKVRHALDVIAFGMVAGYFPKLQKEVSQ